MLLGDGFADYLFILKDLFIHLRESEHEQRQRAEGEAESPLSREPYVCLVPGPQDHD